MHVAIFIIETNHVTQSITVILPCIQDVPRRNFLFVVFILFYSVTFFFFHIGLLINGTICWALKK